MFLLSSVFWLAYAYTNQVTLLTLLWAIGVSTIAIGGYVQNFYDDQVNPTRTYYSLPWLLIGNITLLTLSFFTNQWLFSSSGLLASLMLYFYSTRLKKHGLLGNITVALLTAWVFIGLALLLAITTVFNNLTSLLLLSFFAFTTTLSREWIKDIQDVDEDIILGRKTLPMLIGIKYTYIINTLLSLVITCYLMYVSKQQTGYLFYWLILLCISYVLASIYYYNKPNKAKHQQLVIKIFQAIMILTWPFVDV